MLSVADLEKIIDDFAPFSLAYDWDNSGLQVGDRKKEVDSILLALDLSEEVMKEAEKKSCDVIITHHPLIFSPLESVLRGSPRGNLVYSLIEKNISLLSVHTNLDRAEGGLNDFLAHRLGLERIEFMQSDEDMQKLVVFVPTDDLQDVKLALHEAGAGEFDRYDMAGFYTEGTGTFRPLEGSEPALGSRRDYNEVEECRLETIMPARKSETIISRLLEVHPYEEPAYDVIGLEQHSGELIPARLGSLKKSMKLKDFTQNIRERLELQGVKFCGAEDRTVSRAAVACGSGADFIESAAAMEVDVLITGDMKYHDWEKARDNDLAVVDAGHHGTEKIFSELMEIKLNEYDRISEKEVSILISDHQKPLWQSSEDIRNH